MPFKLFPFFAKDKAVRFDRTAYYKSLKTVTRSPIAPPSKMGRRGVVKGFTAAVVGGASYLMLRPTTLFNRSSMELLAHFDLEETLPASGNVSYIRRPGLKPLSPNLDETQYADSSVATAAELAEYGDAEAGVQLPSLSGVTDNNFAAIERETTQVEPQPQPQLNNLFESLVGENASQSVDETVAVAQQEIQEIAKLVLPIKPSPKPDTSLFAPILPKDKGKAPLRLASLVDPATGSNGSNGARSRVTSSSSGQGTRTLKLFSVNTGDRIEATFMKDGKFISSELARLNWLMRDRRTGTQTKIDPELYNLMFGLTAKLGLVGSTVNIISGYRSKKTNDMLRRRSSGVASSSYHTRGKAVDLFIPSARLSSVHKNALSLNGGGVGYYPSSNFVHIDTGPLRNWPNKYKHIAGKYQRRA